MQTVPISEIYSLTGWNRARDNGDGTFTLYWPDETPSPIEQTPEQIAAAAVPRSVSMRQARLALLGAGLLPAVNAALAALPEPQKTAAAITWEYSTEVQRSNGLVPQMATALGMTPQQIDALFIAAAAL